MSKLIVIRAIDDYDHWSVFDNMCLNVAGQTIFSSRLFELGYYCSTRNAVFTYCFG